MGAMAARFFVGLLFPVCLLSAFGADDCAFWVWHRRDPLHAEERQLLADMGASLLWHVGELHLGDGRSPAHWLWREDLPEEGAIPVVRLSLQGGGEPFDQPELVKSLAGLADRRGRLQIDCDCPDRLLPRYTQFLKQLRKLVPHLSATALAGWSHNAVFRALQENVEQLDVMFYDLFPDAPLGSENPSPIPLLDDRVFARQLESWGECKIPWRAGLPNFSRITVFDSSGHSLGNIRNWTWCDVVFEPRLKFLYVAGPGLILMKAQSDLVVAKTPIKSGSYVAIRQVDGEMLCRALVEVKKCNARGPAFFRLPDSTDPSGWSLEQLRQWFNGSKEGARLRLKKVR